jgi:hypothetical protein
MPAFFNLLVDFLVGRDTVVTGGTMSFATADCLLKAKVAASLVRLGVDVGLLAADVVLSLPESCSVGGDGDASAAAILKSPRE